MKCDLLMKTLVCCACAHKNNCYLRIHYFICIIHSNFSKVFYLNPKIVVKSKWHKIHDFGSFKVPRLLVLEKFTVLSWRTLLLVERKVYTDNSAGFSLSRPQQVPFYFLFLGLTILKISCKGTCTSSVFWEWLAWLCLMSSGPHCVVAYSEGWHTPPSPVAYMTAGLADSGPQALNHLLSLDPGAWNSNQG